MAIARRLRTTGAFLALAVGASGLAGCDRATTSLFDAACARTLKVGTAGVVPTPPLNEASGIAASQVHDGTWYVHNDKGDTPRLVALNATGSVRATLHLTGADAVDWEDIAVGPPAPGAARPRIFVGDIGDNTKVRSSITVYRLAEPTLPSTNAALDVSADALTLVYPDGPHNAEAMFVHWGQRRLYIVEKLALGGPARVYSAPIDAAAGSTTTMTKVGTVWLPADNRGVVTGADALADGSLIILRTYGAVRLYNATGLTPQQALRTTVCRGPVPNETQGEALGIAPDGSRYVTLAEGQNRPLRTFTAP